MRWVSQVGSFICSGINKSKYQRLHYILRQYVYSSEVGKTFPSKTTNLEAIKERRDKCHLEMFFKTACPIIPPTK